MSIVGVLHKYVDISIITANFVCSIITNSQKNVINAIHILPHYVLDSICDFYMEHSSIDAHDI